MSQPILFASDALLFCAAKDKQALGQHIQSLLQHPVWNEAFVVAQHSQIDAQSTCRLFVIADDFQELRQRAEKALASLQRGIRREGRIGKGIFYNSNSAAKQGGIAFVFPGQGCQFPGMGSMLAKRYPTVETWIKRLDEALLDTVGEKVSGYYYEGKYAKELHPKLFNLDIGACVVNTLSLAYHELLTRVGIQADVYLGHSTGELTALMASDYIEGGSNSRTFASVLRSLVRAYSHASQMNEAPKGTLFSVAMLSSEKIAACFPQPSKNIFIALDNCPNQKIVFCPNVQSDELLISLQQAGAMVDTLPFYYAYHTPLFSALNKAMAPFYEGLKFNKAKALIYSCISMVKIPDEGEKAKILLSSLLETQVNFQKTIETLCTVENIQTFIEVGPRNNISSFMNDILQAKDAQVISTGLANVDEVEAFLQMLGQLFIAGKIHNVSKLYSERDLPKEPLTLIQKSEVNTAKVVTKHSLERSAMLQVHFNLMQAFLLQQKRVMRLIHQLAEQSPDQKEDKTIVSPFLGDLVSRDAKKAHWVREVTLEKEPYLLDHSFGGEPSLLAKELSALPVIPFTFSLETTVEAALTLAGKGWAVQRMFDVRALSWFILFGQPLNLEIHAQYMDQKHISCRIFNVTGGEKRLSFESKVEIAWQQKPVPSSLNLNPSSGMTTPYHKGNLYIEAQPVKPWVPGEFHGQSFQAVERIISMGDDGVVAELKVLPRHKLLKGVDQPSFLIDPIMIDASIHLTTYWAHSKYGVDLTILPFQMESYQYFSSPSSVDSKITVKVGIQYVQTNGELVPDKAAYRFFDGDGSLITEYFLQDSKEKKAPKDVAYHQLYPETLAIQSDVEFYDEKGTLLAQVQSRLDKHFSLPTRYNKFTHYPTYEYLSEATDGGYKCKPFAHELLFSSGKVWLYKLAYLVLTAEERLYWSHVDENLEYLYQVIVSKDTARAHLLVETGQHYAPIDLSCKSDENTGLWRCKVLYGNTSLPLINIKVWSEKGIYGASLVKS